MEARLTSQEGRGTRHVSLCQRRPVCLHEGEWKGGEQEGRGGEHGVYVENGRPV